MKAIITSAGTAGSVELIKQLGASSRRIATVAADINPYGETAGSQLADSFVRVPFGDDASYVSTLAEIVRTKKVDLLIPINDVEIEAIARERSLLPSDCRCLIPSVSTIQLVRDKAAMTAHAEALGVPCPRKLSVDDSQKRIVRDVTSVGSRGVHILEGPADSEIVRSVNRGLAFVQELIEGPEYTVDILCDSSGMPVYIIPRERVEVKAGVCTKGRITNNTILIEFAHKIARSLRIPGFSNIQFIVDANNVPRFIEVNPRFGAGSAATLKAVPSMFERFLDIVFDEWEADGLRVNSGDIKWGAFVTRYYTEVLYEG